MLKRLFEKDEVWFAVVWIIIYVVGFANADAISESLGYPKLLTVFVGLILTVIIYRFICKKQLKIKVEARAFSSGVLVIHAQIFHGLPFGRPLP